MKIITIQYNNKYLYCKYYHNTILETLKNSNIYTNYQCCDGLCGICKVLLIQGTIQYHKTPLAYIYKNEILLCCSFPITNITIKF